MKAELNGVEFFEPEQDPDPSQHMNEALEQFSSHMNLDVDCEAEFGAVEEQVGEEGDEACLEDKKSLLFSSDYAKERFEQYINENCINKHKCTLNSDEIGFKAGEKLEIDGDIVTVDRSMTGLFGLISDRCKERMRSPTRAITSQIYLGIVGCKYDEILIPIVNIKMHKEKIGAYIVIFDSISMVIMLYFFKKINYLNNEFLEDIDDLRVTMKDFGLQIKNVKLDKYT